MTKFKSIIFYILIFIFYFLLSLPFFSGDVKNHIVWGSSILDQGILGFYQRDFPNFSFPNYPPVSMLFFASCEWLFRTSVSLVQILNNSLSIFPSNLVYFFESENTHITYLKLAAILPLISLGYLYFLLLKKFRNSIKNKYLFTLFLLANPAAVYLSVIWGQNDLLQVSMMLFAFYFLFTKKIWWSFIFSSLAFLSKQTILVLWAIYMLTVLKELGVKRLIQVLAINLIGFFGAYFPFHSPSLTWSFEFFLKSLGTTGFLISDNAINFWGFDSNWLPVDAATKFYSLTYEKLGFALFILFILPLLLIFYKRKTSMERVLHFLFLISLIYFFILTRMHERYLIPAVVIAAFLMIFNKKYFVSFTLVTLIEFLNLYRGLYLPYNSLLSSLVQNILFLQTLVLGYFVLIFYNVYIFVRNKYSDE